MKLSKQETEEPSETLLRLEKSKEPPPIVLKAGASVHCVVAASLRVAAQSALAGRSAVTRLIWHLALAVALVTTQTACVSTGPQKLSRDQANQLERGEKITLTLRDKSKIRTTYLGKDDSGILTEQGRFEHDQIHYLEVERFSAGETALRSVAFVYILAAIGAYMLGRAFEDGFENDDG